MTRAPSLRCGFFAQHQIEELDPAEQRLRSHGAASCRKPSAEAVRARLARFGFGGDKAFVARQ